MPKSLPRSLFGPDAEIYGGAEFSACKSYRYSLWRVWGDRTNAVGFIGLNPSTADETIDDPTIRRCIRFAKDWGYGSMVMLNLFAFRSTDPRKMIEASDPVGRPWHDEHLMSCQATCRLLIACWGNHGTSVGGRDQEVIRLLARPLHCLGRNKNGQPKHPLYVPAATKPEHFWSPAE